MARDALNRQRWVIDQRKQARGAFARSQAALEAKRAADRAASLDALRNLEATLLADNAANVARGGQDMMPTIEAVRAAIALTTSDAT